MHFRDKSEREKFFVTFAETPNKWRRVTVSCDYRNAEPGSLEQDLRELQFQRDKSLQIYESIRDSLADIQFYDTVTNLKLETSDGRLHVHVTEDINETIPYPPKSTVTHVLANPQTRPREIRECDLTFLAHLSGFVYKVSYEGQTFIKKEIPGPDTVDEFLYEINALHALDGSKHVISLEAIVLDDSGQIVKGLLIGYAEQGAIVDILYDHKGNIPWESRLKWAKNAVEGLSEIHEEGYVQGDCTLSNIVVVGNGEAKIIDINRRGCPVGWEPPEIAEKIASHQRISMYIGEKTDLYQLGMSLWALAMDDDEPERHDPPLMTDEFPSEIPAFYRDIVRICLSPRPRDRLSAKELLKLFPAEELQVIKPSLGRSMKMPARAEKQYIDPAAAVERDDIEKFNNGRIEWNDIACSSSSSKHDDTFTYPISSGYDIESRSSQWEHARPSSSLKHRNSNQSQDEKRKPSPSGKHYNDVEEQLRQAVKEMKIGRSGDDSRKKIYSKVSEPEARRGRAPPADIEIWNREELDQRADDEDAMTTDDEDPQVISISPGGEREYDELDLNGHRFLVPHNVWSAADRDMVNRGIDSIVNRHVHDSSDEPELIVPPQLNVNSLETLERPTLLSRTSVASSNTPRNSHVILSSTSSLLDAAPEQTGQPQSFIPPNFRYKDSGFDEPHLYENEGEEDVPFPPEPKRRSPQTTPAYAS